MQEWLTVEDAQRKIRASNVLWALAVRFYNAPYGQGAPSFWELKGAKRCFVAAYGEKLAESIIEKAKKGVTL